MKIKKKIIKAAKPCHRNCLVNIILNFIGDQRWGVAMFISKQHSPWPDWSDARLLCQPGEAADQGDGPEAEGGLLLQDRCAPTSLHWHDAHMQVY